MGKRLVEAVRWATATAGQVGPAWFKTQNYGFLAETLSEGEFADEFGGFREVADPDEPVRPKPRQFSPAKVSEMEATLLWPTLFLGALPGPAGVLKVWVRCKVTRRQFDEATRQRGWPRRTAYRALDKALGAIAVGLTERGVDPNGSGR